MLETISQDITSNDNIARNGRIKVYKCICLPMFNINTVFKYVDFSFPLNFLSLFLRAVVFIRCYLSIPYIILSVIMDVNGVFKTHFFTILVKTMVRNYSKHLVTKYLEAYEAMPKVVK